MSGLDATVSERDGVAVVALVGALVGAEVADVQKHLARLFRRTPPILVIDLSGVSACDAAGALLIEAAATVAADLGGEVRLAGGSDDLRRLLEDATDLQPTRAFRTVIGAVLGDEADLVAPPERAPFEAVVESD